MSEPDDSLLPRKDADPNAAQAVPRPRRLRRFLLRHLPLTVAGVVLLTIASVTAGYFWASSPGFENLVRKRLAGTLEAATGGRVEIAHFHWDLLHLTAEADGIVIHGLEGAGEAPYAEVDKLKVEISILEVVSPRVLLRSLVVSRPQLHLIVYEDGSTNQPHPRKASKGGRSGLDTLFDLQAGHVAVDQGVLDYDDRGAGFDFQNRYIPLDFAINDASLRLTYAPASRGNPESFHVEAGAGALNLARGGAKSSSPASRAARTAEGRFEAKVDLVRAAVFLRSLRVTADGHTLEISGTLQDFAHPHWVAKASGELDLRLLEPVTGYNLSPEGVARLDVAAAGQGGQFVADGPVHFDNASHIQPGVILTGAEVDAHVHADPEKLLVTQVVARLRQGGRIEGQVALSPWLPSGRPRAVVRPAQQAVLRAAESKAKSEGKVFHAPPEDIPINGKVTARVIDVSLDTVLDIVGQGPFQRLGLDALLNGPVTATWARGEPLTTVVSASLEASPSGHPAAGEVATSGLLDGTYAQRNGAVELRSLVLHTPGTEVVAHGQLGAYPMTSPSGFAVEIHTANLNDFDVVLRDLGLIRNGKSGTAALPLSLGGQADFKGMWAGTLLDPHLSGTAKGTKITLEMPPAPGDKTGNPQMVGWDTAEATGVYSAARIAIDHGQLQRGKAAISVDGSLTPGRVEAVPGDAPVPVYDGDSQVRLRVRASKVSVGDMLPLTGQTLPVTGLLDAQIDAEGAVKTLNGSGWLEVNGGAFWGEPVARVRAQGSIANQEIRLTSVKLSEETGKISATGSFNLKSRQLRIDARGAGIDVSRLEWARQKGLAITGQLGFAVTGAGTLDDPRLEARASLPDLAVSGEPLGSLEFAAHTAGKAVTYDLASRIEAAQLTAHGRTELNGDKSTQARLEFSQFNIGSLIKLAHLKGLSGESALAGTITVAGPLARPEEMRGEANLQQLAVTVAGVHLHSEGSAHATLVNSKVNLDPLHVMGENTDLRAQGSLELKGKQQLDIAASGSINLKVAETIDPDLTATGTSTFQVEAHGPLANPGMRGRVEFQDGSLSLEDLPNGLSQLHGTLEFNQNRLEVKSLTAMSGGGLLSVGGYLSYQHGLYADVTASGKGIRIRYPQGVSSLADASLHLQGPQTNLLLSGDVLITRFTVSPDLDVVALAAQANAVQPVAPPEAPSNHVRLDVHLTSSPQLSFQNAYAKLAGYVDLRVRGTVASPSLLGRVSITEGSANIAGTRYELQRGDISFTNPVRIQPSIDMNATAHVEDYDITLGVHGTPDKLAVTYRSDPPLPEADVVALLALGRTESQQRIYTQQQESAGSNPATDALLGGALNATVSSRVQRLFGAGAVKVDPSYLGALGNSTSRITVEEQLGSNVKLTYATNVNTTAQQLIQAEVAINHHVSLLVARDESGVFSMVVKATRRYR